MAISDDEAQVGRSRYERAGILGGGRATLTIDLAAAAMVVVVGGWAAIGHLSTGAVPPFAWASQIDVEDDAGLSVSDRHAALRLDDAFGRGGKFLELAGGADRPRLQFAPAIGAPAVERPLDAVAAEGAFERTDHGVARLGWQIPAAAFAIGSQFEHGWLRRIGFSITRR
jgi:hypothetical protein